MRTLRSEWGKFCSDPGLAALAVGLALATFALSALQAGRAELPACPQELPGCERPIIDRVELSLSGVFFGQSLAVVLAVLIVAEEYTTGLVAATLLANPRRLAVVAAKAATAVGTVALAGAAAVAASMTAAAAVLPARGFTAANGYGALSLTDPAVLRAGAGTVVYLGLLALLAVGITFAVRDTTGALALALSLVYLLPLVGFVWRDETLARLIERYAPMPAGTAIQTTIDVAALPIGGWAGQAVVACWSVCAVVTGWVVFTARDA